MKSILFIPVQHNVDTRDLKHLYIDLLQFIEKWIGLAGMTGPLVSFLIEKYMDFLASYKKKRLFVKEKR